MKILRIGILFILVQHPKLNKEITKILEKTNHKNFILNIEVLKTIQVNASELVLKKELVIEKKYMSKFR